MKMTDRYPSLRNWLLFSLGLVFVLFIQGAIPFIMAPTLGQAIWTMGFSQSFANDSIFSIYARNFGAPEPAPIALGLSGAWPAALFIRLGLPPVDAYTLMVAVWLSVAFFFAFRLGRYFSLSHKMAVLGAVAWGTMPIIWAHAGYSMLSIGIALLPFYFFSLIYFIDSIDEGGAVDGVKLFLRSVLYLMACVVSVFMDGYTFLMFVVASGILLFTRFIFGGKKEKWRLASLVPFCGVMMFLSYVFYKGYVGGGISRWSLLIGFVVGELTFLS